MPTSALLRRLAAFVLLTVLLAYGLHYLISWSLQRVTAGEIGSFNRAMQGRVNADIVITGSSRAYRHYDPRILSRVTGLAAFNLGRNASQIDLQLAVLKAYLRHNRKPLLVIQNLDIQSFILTKPEEVFHPSEYVPYLRDPEIYACLEKINGPLWKWKYIPLYVFATEDTTFTWTSGLKSLAGFGAEEQTFDGFSPVDKAWTNDFERFKRAHPDGIEPDIDEGGIAAVRELIAVCRQAGIQLALVYSPQYHEMVGLTRNRAKIFALFKSLSEEGKVPFLDYTDSPLSQSRDYFYNAQHLNERGAALFSEDLGRQLIERNIIPGQLAPAK